MNGDHEGQQQLTPPSKGIPARVDRSRLRINTHPKGDCGGRLTCPRARSVLVEHTSPGVMDEVVRYRLYLLVISSATPPSQRA